MGAFNPHAQADCNGGSLVTVDLQAPWNIPNVKVIINDVTFTVTHEVRFDLVDGPWWVAPHAVTWHVPGDTATVSAIFYEVDREGHVFEHVKGSKDVVALPATGCEVSTSAPSQVTTTTTAGSVPPPTLPTIETSTTVGVVPPVHRELPPTGAFTVAVLTVAAGCVAVGNVLRKVGAR